MKKIIQSIFVVLLLFLFMAQPAITGPTPPDRYRISPDPLEEDPWDETRSNNTTNKSIIMEDVGDNVVYSNGIIPLIIFNKSFVIIVVQNDKSVSTVSLEDEYNSNK